MSILVNFAFLVHCGSPHFAPGVYVKFFKIQCMEGVQSNEEMIMNQRGLNIISTSEQGSKMEKDP